MTREEHLVFCKVCTKRQMSSDKGLVCSLTGEHAQFEESCPSYEVDQEAKLDLEHKAKAQEPEEKESVGIWTLIIGVVLIVRGLMRISQGELGIFGIVMMGIGLVSVGVYLRQYIST